MSEEASCSSEVFSLAPFSDGKLQGSRRGLFIPTRGNDTAQDTARLIYQNVIAHYGIPREIVSNRDRLWSGAFWTEVCKYLDVKRLLSTAYHPQTDGQTERFNQELEQYLRAFCNFRQDDWVDWLPIAQFVHNSQVHSATGKSPFKTPCNNLRPFSPHKYGRWKTALLAQIRTSMANLAPQGRGFVLRCQGPGPLRFRGY